MHSSVAVSGRRRVSLTAPACAGDTLLIEAVGDVMADVFISYSQQTRAAAEALAQALSGRGLEVWWDTRLTSGQRFDDEIRSQLRAAGAAIVIWCPTSVTSDYVLMEAGIAYAWERLITVRTADLPVENIPGPFCGLHADLVTDIERIMVALGEHEVVPKSAGGRKRMTKDEILSALKVIDAALPARLLAWLEKCQAAGFRVVTGRSLMVKATIPFLGDVNFGTILADGTLNTNYISESADRIGVPDIAADYLACVARLIDGASVRRDGKPWTWRVEVFGALPAVSALLDRGDEWLGFMTTARQQFLLMAEAATI